MANEPRIHAVPAFSEWKDLELGSGWSAKENHTPQYCVLGDLVFITGAVILGSGAWWGKLAVLPAEARPSTTQFVGSVTSQSGYKTYTNELYVGPDGRLSIDGYVGQPSQQGAVIPLAVFFRLV